MEELEAPLSSSIATSDPNESETFPGLASFGLSDFRD
jgi:hypothetical protein